MRTFILAVAVAFAAPAFAEPTAIINGTVHTLGEAGVIKNGVVVFDKGVITAVGAGITPPKDAKVIDAKGADVTPGLMNSFTYLGLLEVFQDKSTNDTTADKAPFRSAISDFYLTNPIARASATMAECSALAAGQRTLTAAE